MDLFDLLVENRRVTLNERAALYVAHAFATSKQLGPVFIMNTVSKNTRLVHTDVAGKHCTSAMITTFEVRSREGKDFKVYVVLDAPSYESVFPLDYTLTGLVVIRYQLYRQQDPINSGLAVAFVLDSGPPIHIDLTSLRYLRDKTQEFYDQWSRFLD